MQQRQNTELGQRAGLVSIVIPTIGRGSLVEAVSSVAAQTYRPVEIIVVDDASDSPPDEDVLRKLAGDCPLLVLRQPRRSGGAAARNAGIDAAKGMYVGFLDDDDVYYPVKLATLVATLGLNPSADAAFGKMKFFDGTNFVVPLAYPKVFDPRTNIMVMNYIHNNASLIRARALSQLRFHEALTRFQDLQFNIELSYRFNVAFVDEFVAEWRIDGRQDQITHAGGKEKRRKDMVAFRAAYDYLEQSVGVPASWLALFQVRMVRESLSVGSMGRAAKILIDRGSFIWRPQSLVSALRARRRLWV